MSSSVPKISDNSSSLPSQSTSVSYTHLVASPYTELIIGQRPDGSCRIFCIRTADEPLILKLSGFSYCFGVRFDDSLYYRLPGHPFPFPADLLQMCIRDSYCIW